MPTVLFVFFLSFKAADIPFFQIMTHSSSQIAAMLIFLSVAGRKLELHVDVVRTTPDQVNHWTGIKAPPVLST